MLLLREPPAETDNKGKKSKKGREEEDIDFVGLADNDRVLLKIPSLAVEEEGHMAVPKALIARNSAAGFGGQMRLRTNLTDPHVYVFSSWTLSLLGE